MRRLTDGERDVMMEIEADARAIAEDMEEEDETGPEVPYGVVAYEFRMAGEAVAELRADWITEAPSATEDEFPW